MTPFSDGMTRRMDVRMEWMNEWNESVKMSKRCDEGICALQILQHHQQQHEQSSKDQHTIFVWVHLSDEDY